MTLQCDRRDEAAAYVLGELEGARLSRFKLHLRGCPVCTEEVELLELAAEAVPLLATRQAPRDSLPVSERADAEFKLQEALHQKPHLRAIIGGAGKGTGEGERGDPPRRRARRGRIPQQVTIAVGALLVVAVMAYVLTHESNQIHYVRAEVGWSGGGAVVKVQGTRAELLVEGMPAAPAGRFYEVWVRYKQSSKLTPTRARVGLNSLGEAGVGIPADIDDAVALAVYEEPTHGPSTTNSGAVIVADLRAVTEPKTDTLTTQ